MKADRPTRQEGFSLLEAVVALAIVGLAMTAFYRAVGASYGMQARLGNLAQTVELAQSQLDGLGVANRLAPGATHGVYETGFGWTLTVTPIGRTEDGTASGDRAQAPAAFWIELRVRDRRGHTVLQLETSRVLGSTL